MAGVMDGVNQRTRLVGHNRLELLLFRLGSRQRFGINVFKIQEVIKCPPLTHVPRSHPVVRGIAHMRGKTITVMDLGLAIGGPALKDYAGSFIIITEYNRSIQGFLVGSVDRIVNMKWETILPPPNGTGNNSYMTAVTHVDNDLVEIIDVEKVLAEVNGTVTEVSDAVLQQGGEEAAERRTHQHILVVDDSSVARKQIVRTLEQLGVTCTVACDGRQALTLLQKLAEEEIPLTDRFAMVISDVEMPEMDGYTLTTEIRKDPRMKDLYVMLHTSLSGVFNAALVQKVGADTFLPKFHADDLAQNVIKRLEQVSAQHAA